MFCPNYKNREVFDKFNEMIEAFGGTPMTEEEFKSAELRNLRRGQDYSAMEAAYKAYHRNAGNFLDSTPDGKESILFNTLLEHFGNRADAIIAKSNVYSDEFFNWFGDWTSDTNDFNLDNIDYSLVDVEEYTKPWKDNPEKSNRAIRIYLKDQHEKGFFELVKDHEDGYFSVHFKTTKEGAKYNSPTAEPSSKEDRKILFQQLVNAIPNGAKVSTWGSLSEDGVLGLNNVGRNMTKVGERDATLKSNGSSIKIPIYQKGVDVSKVVDENGEPLVVWHGTRTSDSIKTNGFDKSMSGKGNRGANNKLFYFTSSYNNAVYTGIKAHEVDDIIDIVTSVYDLFDSDNLPTTKDIYKAIDGLYNRINELTLLLHNVKDDSFIKRVFNKILLFLGVDYTDSSSVKKEYERLITSLDSEIEELSRKAKIVSYLTTGLEFIGGNKEHTSVNTLHFIKESINPNSKYKQVAANQVINAMYGTQNLIYSPEALPLYLNIKNPLESDFLMSPDEENPLMAGRYSSIFIEYQKKEKQLLDQLESSNYDGSISKNKFDVLFGDVYIAKEPNQIKHVENLGTWSTKDSNIYYSLDTTEEPIDNTLSELQLSNKFKRASIQSLFGKELTDGKTVSSNVLLKRCLTQNTFSNSNNELAALLSRHDIPVKLEELPSGKLMATRTYADGSVVILINPNHSNRLSNRRLSDSLLHEVIHALTVSAITNPKTKEDIEFAKRNRQMFLLFDKLFPAEIFNRNDMDTGYYILKNENEFAAVFATDQNARYKLFNKAIQEDKKSNAILRIIKRFINSLARLIVNENVFKDIKQDQLQLYYNTARKYLINKKSIVRGNIKEAALFKHVYDLMDGETQHFDGVQSSIESILLQGYEEDAAVDVSDMYKRAAPSDVYVSDKAHAKGRITEVKQTVVEGLVKRLQAIRSSTLAEDYKTQQELIIQSHIQMFKSDTISDFVALTNLVSLILPTIKKDKNRLLSISKNDNYVMSATDYMYHMHSNFGTYKVILGGVKNALRYEEVQKYLNELFEDDQNNALSLRYSMDLLNDSVNDAITTIDDGINILNDLLIRTVYEDLKEIGVDTNSPDMVEYLQELRRIGYDTSGFIKTFGSADRAKDHGLRAIAYLANKANREADSRTVNRAVELLRIKDQLKSGESELDIYELDDQGLTTGYMVRKVNYGLFLKDYNAEIERINDYISKKYNIALDPQNRVAPENPDARKEWNDMRNKWLGDNSERKYKKEYYEAFSKLSEITRTRRNEIQRQISAIKADALGNDGYYHYERLSKDQWTTLLGLYIQKRILASDYDANGNLKQEGEPDYIVAKELQQLHQDLYGDKQIATDREAWERALESYKESIKDKSEKEQLNLIKKWHDRNSQRRLKIVDGKVLLWKRIDDETLTLPVYEYKGDRGATYEKNNQEINKLLNLYRNRNTWNVDVTRMPDSVKDRIRKLEKENDKIARMAKKKNRKLKLIVAERQKIFKKYAKWAATEEYLKLRKEIFKGAGEETSDELYDMFLASTGTFYGPDMEYYRRFRWFNKVEVLPEYQEEFTELVPGDGFINTEENDSLINENYQKLSKQIGIPGQETTMSMIPKTNIKNGRYDNSKAYNKIFGENGSKSLQNLYKAVYDTVKESNERNYQLKYCDNYQLPLITGSFFKRLKRQGNRWHAALEYVKDEVGWDGRIMPSDLDYGDTIDRVLENVDEFSQIVSNDSGTFNTKSVGTYGDGRRLNIVPQYYTRKLRDPSQLSSDLVGITLEYFNASLRYSHKNAIKDKCEAIVDMMRNRTYYNEKTVSDKKVDSTEEVIKTKPGAESNTYQMASKFVLMNLYNIRDANTYNIFGREINFGKLASLFRAATVAINLGCNIAVAGTGFLTAGYSHIIQAISGQHYTLKDAISGGNTVMWHLLMNVGGSKYIGNKLSLDKLMVTMEYFNIADQGKRKYEHTNRKRAVNVVNDNWCFGMLTGFDFVVKANIATSTLYSFHYYNGEFITQEDLLANMATKTVDEVNEALAEWETGKNLWSVIDVKDGKFTVEDKYKEAFSKVEHVVQSRISKYSESADGMATETQKAAITTGWVGSAILTHRQYLPILLLDRLFGEMVWDMDMQQYQGGVFRTLGLLLLCMYDGIRARDISRGKETYNKYFNDNSSTAASLKSRARRYQLKQIAAEFLTYKLLISPLVSVLCSYADESENKDDKLLLLLAYIMVRFRWESFTPYRVDDIFNTLKTVSAQTGTIDKIDALNNDIIKTIMPQGDLYNTFLRPNIKSKSKYNSVVLRGIYEDWYKAYRDMFKFLPIHNAYEQIYGSKQKRDYYTNQIEKLNS